MLKIKNHRLSGAGVSQQPNSNTGGVRCPRLLILRSAAVCCLTDSVRSLNTHKPQCSASVHVVIGRDGRVVPGKACPPREITAGSGSPRKGWESNDSISRAAS